MVFLDGAWKTSTGGVSDVRPARRDYDQDPDRFRAGARLTACHLEPGVSLYATVAAVLREHGARRTVDIGCGEGALRAAGVDGWLVGVDASSVLLRAWHLRSSRLMPPHCRSPRPASTPRWR